MGTSNFHNVNSGRIYSVEIEEEWDYDDLKENLIYELKDSHTTKDPYELRSYSSSVVGCLSKQKSFGELDIDLSIYCVIRSGYYEGANLDWFMKLDIGNTSYYDEIPENCYIEEDLRYFNDWNVGFSVIQSKNVLNWIKTTKEELVNRIEKIYEENSTPLEVVARFSNGETIYKKS
jgi:hypothetical protein